MHVRLSGVSWLYALALTALGCVLISVLGTIVASVTQGSDFGTFTGANFPRLFAERGLAAVFGRTLVQGGGTVVVMVAFAVPIAWLVARTDLPGKRLVVTLLTAALAIPGFITAMSYVWLFNPNSGLVNALITQSGLSSGPIFNVYNLGWMCFLQGMVLVPAAVFMMLPAFQNMDATLEEAAWVSGVPRSRTLRRVVLPLLAPAVVAALLFFFVVAIEIFDFVGLIGMPGHVEVLSLWIYDALHPTSTLPNYGFAGAASLLMFAISGAAIALYVRFLRNSQRYALIGGKLRRSELAPLGRWRSPALGLIALWMTLAFVLPVITLIWVSFLPYLEAPSRAALATATTANYAFALTYIATPLRNTLVFVAGTVVLAVIWSAAISWIVTRRRGRLGAWMDAIVFLSPAVPSIAAAVSFQIAGIAVNHWLPLYGTVWLMMVAMATRMLSFCTRTVNGTALQIHAELDEVAYACGVSRLVTFRRIFLPIVAPALFYSALMVGMLAARELTLPLMMDNGHSPVIATLIFDLQTNGRVGTASAVALFMMAILVAIVLVARRLAGIGDRGAAHGLGP
jgi:iron(III) transport system permease protein